MCRKRTNMKDLVSHTTPDGRSYQSNRNKCETKLYKLQKLIDAGFKLVGATKVNPKEENFKIVMVFNQPMKITLEEYNKHWVIAFGDKKK